MKHGFTVKPTLYVDANGIEHVSYDKPNITSTASVEKAIQYHNQNQDKYVSQDEHGNQFHVADRFSVTEQGSIYDRVTGKFTETEESVQFLNQAEAPHKKLTREQFDNVVNAVGSPKEFVQLRNWSKKNASMELNQLLAKAVQEGNTEQFKMLYLQMREQYESERGMK